VLGPDVVVAQDPGFFLSKDDNSPGSEGESLEHRAAFDRMLVLERTPGL